MKSIERLNYRNAKKNLNFEIVDLALFFATRSRKLLLKEHRMDFYAILYITAGSGVHDVDFKRIQLTPGSILFIQKNQISRFNDFAELQGYIIHISESFLYEINHDIGVAYMRFLESQIDSPVLYTANSPESTPRILIDLISKEYLTLDDNVDISLIAALFYGFIRSLISANLIIASRVNAIGKSYETFQAFKKLLEKHYTSQKSVEFYARELHISKKTLNLACRQAVGITAKRYIINRVLLEIKRYLIQDEYYSYQISSILGFDEPANMTNFFKRYEHISPRAFRKTKLNNHDAIKP